MRSACWLILLGGCELVFKLEDPGCIEPIGHDEDGDGIDDACDLCPQSIDDVDRDGDAVGDACDPRPDDVCEQRLRFDGFAELPGDLVLVAPWEHDPVAGDLRQPDAAPGITLAHYPQLQLSDVIVLGSITITEFFDGAENAEIELGSGGNTNGAEPSAGYACTLHHETADDVSTVLLKNEEPDTALVTNVFSGAALGNTFTFSLINTTAGRVECTIDGLQGRGTAVVDDAPPIANGEVFIVAGNASVRVHWVDFLADTCP